MDVTGAHVGSVVGDEGTVVGLVSLDDILSLLAEEFAQVGTLVEKEMPSGTGSTRLRRPVGEGHGRKGRPPARERRARALPG